MTTQPNADIYGSEVQQDNIPRQQSKCYVVIFSHIVDNDKQGIINCSDDVIECETSKTINGGGGANFVLVPRCNYLNYIFPNDYVNIWFDPGDGRGPIRTFFGFVDRVVRDITVDSDTGATTTRYQVVCSDFVKAFDKTNVYFNPHLANRPDFLGQFSGTTNLGGSQLRLKGITVFGTPADIVLNMATIFLGFNSQFMLPPKYQDYLDEAVLISSRNIRKKWARKRLSKEIQRAIGQETINEWIQSIENDIKNLKSKWNESGTMTDMNGNPIYGPPRYDIRTPVGEYAYARDIVLANRKANINPALLDGTSFTTSMQVEGTATVSSKSLMDLIDLSFIEYLAIDGSILSCPIWTQQGSVWSMMKSYSNPEINELFVDLRPLSELYGEDEPLREGRYLVGQDKILSNLGISTDPSVRFVPAVVMREYPYSTIKEIDLSKVQIYGQRLGVVQVGAIFSAMPPNKPGRATTLIYPALHDYVSEIDPTAVATKHLDVAVISVTDIFSENLGRSDHDHENLIEMVSDGVVGESSKYTNLNIQPIVSSIFVARHGLRVRSYSTRFAQYQKESVKSTGIDSATTQRKVLRWVLMIDHWYQHNIEYLNGTITTRAFPEIRVGYRLDIRERNESYYVDGVNHRWSYPGVMTTSLTLSRGQRNDPFPVYVKPQLPLLNGIRDDVSRLASFFKQVDPEAVKRAVSQHLMYEDLGVDSRQDELNNLVDDPATHADTWGGNQDGFISASTEDGEKFYLKRELTDKQEYDPSSSQGILNKFLEEDGPNETLDFYDNSGGVAKY